MPKPTKTIDKWVAKGWTTLYVTAGATESDPIAVDPVTEDIAVAGQVFDADGLAIHGRARPHFSVVEIDEGTAVVQFAAPLAEDTTLLYKIEDAGEDQE